MLGSRLGSKLALGSRLGSKLALGLGSGLGLRLESGLGLRLGLLHPDGGDDHLTSVIPHFSIEKYSVILVENL